MVVSLSFVIVIPGLPFLMILHKEKRGYFGTTPGLITCEFCRKGKIDQTHGKIELTS